MRIVGGTHKGRKLVSPAGLATRPTSDRARESIFNVLQHAGWLEKRGVDDADVLDVFAGTGAMGLEALSRGARHAVFIEQSRPALSACDKNITAMKEESRTKIIAVDALRTPARPAYLAPRTLVFLDPPYNKNLGEKTLMHLLKKNWLAEEVIVVMEMAKKQPEEIPAGFKLHDERNYGVALVRFLGR